MKNAIFCLFIFLTTTVCAQIKIKENVSETSSPSKENNSYVYWISNAGFYIDTPDGGIIIDGILKDDDEIARAKGIFSKTKLIFVSHVHGDHFNALGVLEHMKSNKKVHLILSPESFNVLKSIGLNDSLLPRITVAYPDENTLMPFVAGTFSGHIMQFDHSGVQNIGFALKTKYGNFTYINGGIGNKQLINDLSEKYPENKIVIANKWPLIQRDYIESIKMLFSPKWLLMAHHSGRKDAIIINNGGAEIIEKRMSLGTMKGRIFGKFLERETF